MNMKGLRYLILNIIKFLLFIFLKKNNMNEKKEDYGNFSHGLSNTIKINVFVNKILLTLLFLYGIIWLLDNGKLSIIL